MPVETRRQHNVHHLTLGSKHWAILFLVTGNTMGGCNISRENLHGTLLIGRSTYIVHTFKVNLGDIQGTRVCVALLLFLGQWSKEMEQNLCARLVHSLSIHVVGLMEFTPFFMMSSTSTQSWFDKDLVTPSGLARISTSQSACASMFSASATHVTRQLSGCKSKVWP